MLAYILITLAVLMVYWPLLINLPIPRSLFERIMLIKPDWIYSAQ